ncbi:Cleavage polyadenylation factor subunit clp1 [Binucleata daphniae]
MLLKKNSELRFEGKDITVTVKRGHCEHKGMEMLLNKPYKFENCKSFIFAFEDCEVEIEGENENYASANTNTLETLKYIDEMLAKNKKTILVLGKGKCTFTTMVTNYLFRYGKNVLITELNPRTGYLLFPGCLASVMNSDLIDVNMELNNLLVYYLGSSDTESNKDLFMLYLEKLNNAIQKKDFDFHIAIVNEEILEMVNKFKAFDGECVVLKDEKMYNRIKSEKFYIGGGSYEELDKFANIGRFFYGANRNTFSVKIMKNKCKFVRIGEEYIAPESALPLNTERKLKLDAVIEVEPRVHAILAVLYAESFEDICGSNVRCFVIVESVADNFIKVISPQPNLKCSYMLQGEIDYKNN